MSVSYFNYYSFKENSNFICFSVTMKELKSFLSRVNCKMGTAKLLEHFNVIDVRQRGELRFDDFLRLYQKLLVTPTVSIYQLINYCCITLKNNRV